MKVLVAICIISHFNLYFKHLFHIRHSACQWEYKNKRISALPLLPEKSCVSEQILIYWRFEFVCKACIADIIYFLEKAFSVRESQRAWQVSSRTRTRTSWTSL